MRKIVMICLTFIILMSCNFIGYAEKMNHYEVNIPKYKITINGTEIDNIHNKYPFLEYKNITYMPMTYGFSRGLQLKTNWSQKEGLVIEKADNFEKITQDLSANNDLNKVFYATAPNFKVRVNGKDINNSNEEYPILIYEGITYFPLTWKYTVEEFHFITNWDQADGLSLMSDANVLNDDHPLLEDAIRMQLNKPEGNITKIEIEGIKKLNLSKKGMRDLSGIEQFTNLEELYLDNNNISNIDLLKGLTNLKVLHLQRNKITDLWALAGLMNLEELSINGNRISNLENLRGLTNLKRLYLAENNLTDISPLKNLTNITSLYVKYGNHIRDYGPITSYYKNIIMKDFDEEDVTSVEVQGQKSFLGIEELIDEAKKREKRELKLNGFYSISSQDQFNELKKNNTLNQFDAISFDWAHIAYDKDNDGMVVNFNENFYNYSSGKEAYEELVSALKEKEIETYLNIYADKYYDNIFDQSDSLIEQVMDLLSGKNKNYPDVTFDGVVIDFEKLPNQYGEEYVVFLKELRKEINKSNKKLVVAIQPRDSYEYGEIANVADKVILMLHDYDVKDKNNLKLIENEVENPVAPMERIKGDLIKILNDIDREADLSKLWLQINFSISQWKVSEGEVMNRKAYRPLYESLIQRINMERKKTDDINNVIKYNEKYENPYIVYTENNITNTIWYEDTRSVKEKLNLAKELGLGGISIWKIGNIPDDDSNIYLDTLEQIIENK